VYFADSLNGWLAAGNNAGGGSGEDGRGFIYRTTNAGANWTLEYSAPWPRGWVESFAPQPGGVLWVSGNHATILKGVPPGALAEERLARVRHLGVWPLPAREVVFLAGPAGAELLRADGSRVGKLNPGANDIRLLPAGTYFARAADGRSGKVLIQR